MYILCLCIYCKLWMHLFVCLITCVCRQSVGCIFVNITKSVTSNKWWLLSVFSLSYDALQHRSVFFFRNCDWNYHAFFTYVINLAFMHMTLSFFLSVCMSSLLSFFSYLALYSARASAQVICTEVMWFVSIELWRNSSQSVAQAWLMDGWINGLICAF